MKKHLTVLSTLWVFAPLVLSAQAPNLPTDGSALVISGDAELARPEHALELARTLPHAKLAILPGAHGEYIGEICAADKSSRMPALVTAMIDEFLKR